MNLKDSDSGRVSFVADAEHEIDGGSTAPEASCAHAPGYNKVRGGTTSGRG
jgi:hypothetical protein